MEGQWQEIIIPTHHSAQAEVFIKMDFLPCKKVRNGKCVQPSLPLPLLYIWKLSSRAGRISKSRPNGSDAMVEVRALWCSVAP